MDSVHITSYNGKHPTSILRDWYLVIADCTNYHMLPVSHVFHVPLLHCIGLRIIRIIGQNWSEESIGEPRKTLLWPAKTWLKSRSSMHSTTVPTHTHTQTQRGLSPWFFSSSFFRFPHYVFQPRWESVIELQEPKIKKTESAIAN